MEYKVALKLGLYDFEIARNWYRLVCNPENGGTGMHRDLVFSYIRTNALLIAPFVPHFSEHVWRDILGEQSTVQNAAFPKASGHVDSAALQQQEYMRGVVDALRAAEAQLSRRKGKAKAPADAYDPAKPKHARIYVATQFPDWQNVCVETIKKVYDDRTRTVDNQRLKAELQAAGLLKDKRVMPFCVTFMVCDLVGLQSELTLSSGNYRPRAPRLSGELCLSPRSTACGCLLRTSRLLSSLTIVSLSQWMMRAKSLLPRVKRRVGLRSGQRCQNQGTLQSNSGTYDSTCCTMHGTLRFKYGTWTHPASS